MQIANLNNDTVETGKHIARIVEVEISKDVRFGRYVANVYKPIYRINDKTVRDNGVFMYKKVEGFLYSPQKNWGYAKFLNTVGVKKSNALGESFKFESLINTLVEIEVYEKIFDNEFSTRVKYPVARVLRKVEVPF